MAAARIATAYLVAVNAGAAGLFWYDKKCAEFRQWRIPEATLCATALAGGWIGGSWAMQQFRHKTAKQSFKEKYNTAVAANVAGGGALAASPALRQKLLRFVKHR